MCFKRAVPLGSGCQLIIARESSLFIEDRVPFFGLGGGKVCKIIVASAFYKRAGVPAALWGAFAGATLNNMPQIYRDEYLKINHDSAKLLNMFNKDVQRIENFKDWTDEDIRPIKAPAFIVVGDHDVPTPEHAVEMSRLLPGSRLAILPGAHGQYIGEAMFPGTNSKLPEFFVAMVEDFLAAPVN